MNAQVEKMIEKMPAIERKHFKLMDSSISALYVNGYMSPSLMRKSRDRLVKQIQSAWEEIRKKSA